MALKFNHVLRWIENGVQGTIAPFPLSISTPPVRHSFRRRRPLPTTPKLQG